MQSKEKYQTLIDRLEYRVKPEERQKEAEFLKAYMFPVKRLPKQEKGQDEDYGQDTIEL